MCPTNEKVMLGMSFEPMPDFAGMKEDDSGCVTVADFRKAVKCYFDREEVKQYLNTLEHGRRKAIQEQISLASKSVQNNRRKMPASDVENFFKLALPDAIKYQEELNSRINTYIDGCIISESSTDSKSSLSSTTTATGTASTPSTPSSLLSPLSLWSLSTSSPINVPTFSSSGTSQPLRVHSAPIESSSSSPLPQSRVRTGSLDEKEKKKISTQNWMRRRRERLERILNRSLIQLQGYANKIKSEEKLNLNELTNIRTCYLEKLQALEQKINECFRSWNDENAVALLQEVGERALKNNYAEFEARRNEVYITQLNDFTDNFLVLKHEYQQLRQRVTQGVDAKLIQADEKFGPNLLNELDDTIADIEDVRKLGEQYKDITKQFLEQGGRNLLSPILNGYIFFKKQLSIMKEMAARITVAEEAKREAERKADEEKQSKQRDELQKQQEEREAKAKVAEQMNSIYLKLRERVEDSKGDQPNSAVDINKWFKVFDEQFVTSKMQQVMDSLNSKNISVKEFLDYCFNRFGSASASIVAPEKPAAFAEYAKDYKVAPWIPVVLHRLAESSILQRRAERLVNEWRQITQDHKNFEGGFTYVQQLLKSAQALQGSDNKQVVDLDEKINKLESDLNTVRNSLLQNGLGPKILKIVSEQHTRLLQKINPSRYPSAALPDEAEQLLALSKKKDSDRVSLAKYCIFNKFLTSLQKLDATQLNDPFIVAEAIAKVQREIGADTIHKVLEVNSGWLGLCKSPAHEAYKEIENMLAGIPSKLSSYSYV